MTENKQYIHECIQRDRLDDIIEQLRSIENKLYGLNVLLLRFCLPRLRLFGNVS